MSELKSCPFCGGEVELKRSFYNDWPDAPCYWICHVDHVRAEELMCPTLDDSYDRKADAVKAWNRRANDGN